MKNYEYWKRRQELMQEILMRKADDLIPEMEAKYNAAIRKIEGEIQIFYQRFASNEGLTLPEAKKLLNSDERKAFQMELEEYIKKGMENGISEDWSKQLESASDIYRMDRLKALQMQIREQIEELAGYKQKVLSKTLDEIYSEGYYRNIFEVQSLQGYGEAFCILDTDKINRVLTKPWTYDNMSYSDKIWKNKDTLSYTLDKALTQGIIRGDAPDKIARNIAQEINVELKNAKRLVLTESAAYSAMASRDSYKELGVEQFEYMATLDERTCETCGPMDGQVFKMSEYNIGMTVPPLHPYCRCTTAPYFNDEFTIGENRAARSTDGKVYEVPASMEYNEWKAEYVDNSRENVIIKAAKDNHIRGIINTTPKIIDTSDYTFDDKHINSERNHYVTREEAESYIKSAKVSISRWNGRFVCYIGSEGSTYIDTDNKNIRTSFRRAQYDPDTLRFIEEVEKLED